jgi:hypothetical protein
VTNTFQSLNRYAYVMDNPTTFIDPLGLFMCWNSSTGAFCGNGGGSGPDSGGWGGEGDRAGDPLLVYAPTITHNGAGTGAITVVTKPGSTPDVSKPFQKTFPCGKNAAGVISVVTSDFSKFANYSGGFGPGGLPLANANVNFGQGPVLQGRSISISNTNTFLAPGSSDDLTPASQSVNTSVNVQLVTPTTFTFATVSGHVLYPATITFSAQDLGPGQVRFSIQVNGDFANRIAEALYYLGGGNLENNIWNNLINNVQNSCSQ